MVRGSRDFGSGIYLCWCIGIARDKSNRGSGVSMILASEHKLANTDLQAYLDMLPQATSD